MSKLCRYCPVFCDEQWHRINEAKLPGQLDCDSLTNMFCDSGHYHPILCDWAAESLCFFKQCSVRCIPPYVSWKLLHNQRCLLKKTRFELRRRMEWEKGTHIHKSSPSLIAFTSYFKTDTINMTSRLAEQAVPRLTEHIGNYMVIQQYIVMGQFYWRVICDLTRNDCRPS